MFGMKAEGPKILSVPAEMIEQHIRKHIAEGQTALEGYRVARIEGQGPKVPWDKYIRSTALQIEAYKDMLVCVGQGQHAMSVEQFSDLWNSMGAWFTADDLIKKYDQKEGTDD